MHVRSGFAVVLVMAGLITGCGDDEPGTTTTDRPTVTTSAPTTTSMPPTTVAPEPEQAAVWPAADVVLATPEEAAESFVADALGVPPTLGPFQEGDARSGEIEVFSPGEGAGSTPTLRSVLLLRQLGPDDGWFVLGAVGANAAVAEPAAGEVVSAGPLAVNGTARGFEGTVIVTAFPAGDAAAVVDETITTGGAFADTAPFAAALDLGGVSPGTVVTVLVRGGTGLETDPGDFSAVPVVIGG